jgi:hypothetical protein
MAIWYNLWPFSIVCGHLVYLSHFGMFGPRKIWQPCFRWAAVAPQSWLLPLFPHIHRLNDMYVPIRQLSSPYSNSCLKTGLCFSVAAFFNSSHCLVCYFAKIYIMIHHDTSWYIMIHHDTSWYIMIHHDTSWYIMIHHDTSWYITKLLS